MLNIITIPEKINSSSFFLTHYISLTLLSLSLLIYIHRHIYI